MDTMIAGLRGVVAYLDHVIVVGRTEEDHQRNLDALLQRINELGFHVRLNKCQFAKPEVKYLGCISNKHGRRPDPSRTAAITNMPVPTNVTQLRSFLGMINHYGQFIANLCYVRAPLDRLLQKDVKVEWTNNCQQAFEKVISIVASDLLITHYDPNQEIIVAADASNNGLGTVISHRYPDGSEKALSHASRTLTAAEKHCSHIEKEGFALIFALRKFHKMIHGRKFTLLTNHKPLLALCKGFHNHLFNNFAKDFITIS
uniref:RNA-directed DNA polymerase n=1 Tax=Trichuris muris TaxID=70415 RepID=A0A5S6QPA1_TRIMR